MVVMGMGICIIFVDCLADHNTAIPLHWSNKLLTGVEDNRSVTGIMFLTLEVDPVSFKIADRILS